MPKISNEDSTDRKALVRDLIATHPDGIKVSEIATTLSIPDRTVRDYVAQLEQEYLITHEGLFYKPLGTLARKPLKFEPTPEETVVLYLALRMFVKQSDRRNPLAEHLLYKMAHLASTELNLGNDLQQAAAELAQRPLDEQYQDIYLQVVRAYLHRWKLEIVYHPYRSEPFKTIFETYLFEPSGFGYGAYIIGHSSLPNARRTYRLERIVSAKLLREEFSVPKDFPGLDILRNAWSIFYGENTVRVVLRFAPDVSRRVQESNWRGSNPSLDLDPEYPNYLVYAFDIADTTDLKPWIRTWGAKVEVLAPASLRDEMIGEGRELAHLYGWYTSTTPSGTDENYDDIFGV
jgi:predicted DNA-binding transcriptional regulator YafY